MRAPRVAVLFLSPACNMACEFCGAEAAFSPMSWGKALELLQSLKRRGVESVVLGGGEPFLWREDPRRLAAEARALGLHTQVGSNGSWGMQDAETLRAFDRWVLPLESGEEAVHDAMRPHEGGHLALVKSLLERLRELKVEATISTLVTGENFDTLVALGEWIQAYASRGGRLHAWHLYRFLPVGRGGKLNSSRFLTAPGVFDEIGTLLQSRFPGLTIYRRPDMYHSKRVSFHWSERGKMIEISPEMALLPKA
jgi:MoaA/NifB/PqqE/SkfB family radical SAM enzyme